MRPASYYDTAARLAEAVRIVRPDASASEAATIATRWLGSEDERRRTIATARHRHDVEMPAGMRDAWGVVSALLMQSGAR